MRSDVALAATSRKNDETIEAVFTCLKIGIAILISLFLIMSYVMPGENPDTVTNPVKAVEPIKKFTPEEVAQQLLKEKKAQEKEIAKSKKAEKEVLAARDKLAKEAAKKAKKTGVSIGMTKDQVLASSWGKPQDKNITTTAYGTHEQWVYRNYNYLYFDNDILTSIQNH